MKYMCTTCCIHLCTVKVHVVSKGVHKLKFKGTKVVHDMKFRYTQYEF